MIPRSRDELPQHSDCEATLAQPQPSLGNSVFNALEANVQGTHMIPRSFLELDPTNPLTLMVNQLKTLLDAAQIQTTRVNNPSDSKHLSR